MGFSELYERMDGIVTSWDLKKYTPWIDSLGEKTANDLESEFEEGSRRRRKDSALQGLQLATDSYIEDEITEEEYERVKASAVENVEAFYRGEEFSELILPETDRVSRRSGLPGDEAVIESWAEDLDYDAGEIDRVVSVASGGLEPGIIASKVLDAELDVVRYSKNDHGDEEVIDVDTGYEDSTALVVDDNSFSGETLEEVEDHVRHEAERVYSEAVVNGEYLGEVKALGPQFTHRSWRHRNSQDGLPLK
ncbi:MAG: phosphoribosyltransferase family protein [Candidatus Nanohalobium sp.]